MAPLTQVLLLSTYDLGRQPFGLASPAAWLRQAGHEVTAVDLTRTRLDENAVRAASLIGFFLPMHTATRLALPVLDRVRALNPAAHVVAYGLYAPLNADLLRQHGVTTILGPEFEADLRDLAGSFRLKAEATHLKAEATRLKAEATRMKPEATRVKAEATRVKPEAFRLKAEATRVKPEATGLKPEAAGLKPEATQPSSRETRGFRLQAEDLPRLQFMTPDRTGLPPLTAYASLQDGATRKVVGYTEASRGCKHRCRHCPIVPVYDGRFRIVAADVVVADVAAQVAAGAQHITFGDPDFLNGPKHALAVIDAVHAAFPGVTYDVTIKVEHLLAHADVLPRLRDTGCAFVTSAVESIDDQVLAALEKGHTAADFERVVALFRATGLQLSPTFVAFTPWTTLERYCAFLHALDRLELVEAVAPIQYAIRLLIPKESRMLELSDVRARVDHYDPRTLTHVWRHADPAVDALQHRLEQLAGARLNAPRAEFFARVWDEAHAAAGLPPLPRRPLLSRAAVPYLNEPWYC